MKNTIFQDGKIFHETLTGSYLPETTIFGNPRMNLDFWGHPKINTDYFGNQVVDLDMFGKPIIPVEYPTLKDTYIKKGPASDSGAIASFIFQILPFVLLAGGLYSVFATTAGSFFFVFAAAGILGMFLITLIVDHAKFLRISNGIQPPFYIFTMGWVFCIVPFWIHFFFNMNFDVSNTNYLTWDSMVSGVFPQMGVCACGGVALGVLFSVIFRSDMFAVRKSAQKRRNTKCVTDMLIASFAPPIMAVAISLIWCLIISPIVSLFTRQAWANIANSQSVVMAIAFVILGIIIVIVRSRDMVKKIRQ